MLNTDACGGADNEHDGCGVVFPRMAHGTIHCPLCKKLKVVGLSAEARATLKQTLHQCSECGLCGTMLKDPCGTCKRKVHDENGTIDAESLAAQNARRRQISDRLHRPEGDRASIGPSTPLAELRNLRTNLGSASYFTVFVDVRRSGAAGSVDKILGKTCVPYPEDTTFLALKEMIIADVNPQWTKDHMSDLKSDETELRAHGNVTLGPGIDFFTLRQWYNQQNIAGTKEVYLKVPAGIKNGKGSTFMLELFIHEDMYFERTGENDIDDEVTSDADHVKGKKRRATGHNSTQASKRVRGSKVVALRSTFAPDPEPSAQGHTVSVSNTITFNRTICTINGETGRYSLTESSDVEKGLIERATLFLSAADRGKTKDVYGLVIDSKEYVAKKLVDVGNGRGNMELDDACTFLTSDLVRLKRMEVFARSFHALAMKEGAEIAEFQVSDGFLMKTYRDAGQPASSESGDDPVDPVRNLASVYLVEPRRASSAVLKFSGTLATHNRLDKRSATIMAFSHFVIEDTACLYMFANIQGSMDRSVAVQNASILTLFDPMTHTPRGQSGLGDHGSEGFEEFMKSHRCTHICSSMNLCKVSVLTETLEQIQITNSEE